MEKLIGRKNETDKLSSYMQSDRSEFIAIYGRRRVGKTFLVRSFFKDKFDFYATGIIEGNKSEEMEAFHVALLKYGYVGPRAKTWIEAFMQLADLLEKKNANKKKRLVVFIDELPCFDTQNSGFVHALDFFWNSRGSWMDNIMFIICGSATSWMIRNVVNNRGGLHNRLTHEIHLTPFTLRQTELYIRSKKVQWDRLSILQIYMALGGIPYYLNMLDVTKSATENIDMLFFSDEAKLKTEYNLLYQSLYRNPDEYMEVIDLLATNKTGLTRKEIAENLKVHDNGHLGKILEDLVSCDFLRLYRNGTKQNSGIYQLMDFYTMFYHQFGKRKTSDSHYWSSLTETPTQNTWYGLAYERVCLYHFRQIIYALRLDAIHTEFYSWRSRESVPAAQIDMIIDRSDGIIDLCEVKYSKNEYALAKSEYEKILNREMAFNTETKCKKGIHIVLVSTFGVKRNKYSSIAQHFISLNDLFEDVYY